MMSKLQLALGYNMIEAPIEMMIKLRLALGSKLKGGTHLLLQPSMDLFKKKSNWIHRHLKQFFFNEFFRTRNHCYYCHNLHTLSPSLILAHIATANTATTCKHCHYNHYHNFSLQSLPQTIISITVTGCHIVVHTLLQLVHYLVTQTPYQNFLSTYIQNHYNLLINPQNHAIQIMVIKYMSTRLSSTSEH